MADFYSGQQPDYLAVPSVDYYSGVLILRISREYLQAKNGATYPHHEVVRFIETCLGKQIQKSLGLDQLIIRGGCGNFNTWANVPWIGIFDPKITRGAQQGYYLVYLFSADFESLVLSLNQGVTAIRKEYGDGKRTISILRNRGNVMRHRLTNIPNRFSVTTIDLASDQNLPKMYEAGHAIGRVYDLAELPSEPDLVADLLSALELYQELFWAGGTHELSEEELEEAELENASVREKLTYVIHRSIERNPSTANKVKKLQGYVCKGCGFDFAIRYGEIGKNYIEAHHLIPLSSLLDEEEISMNLLTDFAVLCANCHRMMHRKKSPKTISELRNLIRKHT